MKSWLLIAAPFFLITIAVVIALGWDFNGSSESMARRLADMSVERVSLPVEMVNLTALKKGPFYLKKNLSGAKKDGKKGVKKGVKKEFGKTDLEVSLIVISDKKSLAVIDGQLLSIGDYIKGLLVKKIEKERVLLVGKKKIWKYLKSR